MTVNQMRRKALPRVSAVTVAALIGATIPLNAQSPSAAAPRSGAPEPRVLAKLASETQAVHSPDGKLLLVSDDSTLRVLDRRTGTLKTVATGTFVGLTWAPRGDRVAFERQAPGGRAVHVWTQAVNPSTGVLVGNPLRVTAFEAESPVFSPDGMSVAVVRSERVGNTLTIVPTTGGAERNITTVESGLGSAAWSPDGAWMYYTVRSNSREMPGYPIYRIAASGGAPQLVVARNTSWFARISPDGRFMLYSPGRDTIAVATIDGRILNRVILGDPRTGVTTTAPQWSPDSRAITYVTSKRARSLQAVSVQDARVRALGDDASTNMFPELSPDGQRVAALTNVGGRLQLSIRPLAGGAPRFFRTLDPPYTDPLRWSPDGRYVAVQTGAKYGAMHDNATGMEVVDITTGRSQRLQTPPLVHRYLWRADSRAIRYLAVGSDTAAGKAAMAEVRETPLDGTDTFVRTVGLAGGHRLFVDYDHVYVSARGEIIDLRTGDARQIVPPNAVPQPPGPGRAASVPTASPDGSWIAWPSSGTQDSLTGIHLVSVVTGERRDVRLGFQPYNSRIGLVWAPDGRQLVAAAQVAGDSSSRAWLISLDGAAPRALPAIDRSPEGLAWSFTPDGATLVMANLRPARSHLLEMDLTSSLAKAGRQR